MYLKQLHEKVFLKRPIPGQLACPSTYFINPNALKTCECQRLLVAISLAVTVRNQRVSND